MLTRRFDGALDLLAAWGWNIVHLPGTISRRVRTQSVRTVPDRHLRRFMESAGVRLPRWFARRGTDLRRAAGDRGRKTRTPPSADGCATEPPRSSGHIPSSSRRSSGRVVAAVAFRSLLGPEPLHGGALAMFPGSWQGFFAELASGYRTTGLGGTLAASPVARGDGRALVARVRQHGDRTEGVARGRADPRLRSCSIARSRASPAVPARPSSGRSSYGLSAMVLWSVLGRSHRTRWWRSACCPSSSSDSRSAFGPRRAARRAVAVHRRRRGDARGRDRVHARRGAGRAAVLVVVQVVFGASRGRGLGIAAAACRRRRGAPVPVRAHHGRRRRRGARVSTIGTTDLGSLARLALGGGPGTWSIAAFLPIAAVLAFSLVGPEHRGVASRAVVSAASPAWRSRGARPPATSPRGRRTRRSTWRSRRSERR